MAQVYDFEGMKAFLEGKAVDPSVEVDLNPAITPSRVGELFWEDVNKVRAFAGSTALSTSKWLFRPANETYSRRDIYRQSTPFLIGAQNDGGAFATRIVFDRPPREMPELGQYGWIIDAVLDIPHGKILQQDINARFRPETITAYTLWGSQPFSYDLTTKSRLPELAEDTVSAYAHLVRVIADECRSGTSQPAASGSETAN